jgi:hypothetical protein
MEPWLYGAEPWGVWRKEGEKRKYENPGGTSNISINPKPQCYFYFPSPCVFACDEPPAMRTI